MATLQSKKQLEWFETLTTIELGNVVKQMWRMQNTCEWRALVATSRIVALLASEHNLPDTIVDISLAVRLEAVQAFLKSKPNHYTIVCFVSFVFLQ
jgi:hypothetical protein